MKTPTSAKHVPPERAVCHLLLENTVLKYLLLIQLSSGVKLVLPECTLRPVEHATSPRILSHCCDVLCFFAFRVDCFLGPDNS